MSKCFEMNSKHFAIDLCIYNCINVRCFTTDNKGELIIK